MSIPIIRPATPADAAALAAIYTHYVRESTATLHDTPPSKEKFKQDIANRTYPFLCAADNDKKILGYAYASPFKSRCGYLHTLETSVYIAPNAVGQKVGSALMRALINDIRRTGNIRTIIAVISLPNQASVALHEKTGFAHCGTLPAVGKKFGNWLDIGYWVKDLYAD